MSEPFSYEKSSIEQLKEESQRKKMDRLRRYKRCFQSADGKFVLADMKRLFGFNESSMVYGCTLGDAGLREGMKSPLRHIDAQLAAEMRPEPKPSKAQSGHTEQ